MASPLKERKGKQKEQSSVSGRGSTSTSKKKAEKSTPRAGLPYLAIALTVLAAGGAYFVRTNIVCSLFKADMELIAQRCIPSCT